MEDLIEIAKKQIIPDRGELELVQGIMNLYKHDPWSTEWGAAIVYQAGKIAGKREERARRHRAPRVEIVFTDDKHKSVSIDLETGRAVLNVPKEERVSREELELARNMVQASRAGARQNRKER